MDISPSVLSIMVGINDVGRRYHSNNITTPEKFEELSRAQVFAGSRQAPALLDGRLYLRDSEEVLCIDIRATE